MHTTINVISFCEWGNALMNTKKKNLMLAVIESADRSENF